MSFFLFFFNLYENSPDPSLDLVVKTCNMAAHCPSGLNDDCPSDQTCFPDTPCAATTTAATLSAEVAQNNAQAPEASEQEDSTKFCRHDWNWVMSNCAR